jgi:cyclophilin family peptidyl-prolyl cis-trans isomerase
MNFQLLAAMGCYDNTTFHRVIDDFMIQAGDFTDGDGGGGHAASWQGYCNGQSSQNSTACNATAWTIPDETNNLTHQPFSLSMAKTSAANTGGSQFFILDGNTTADWLDGVHTVFGTVLDGYNVVEAISSVQTGQGDQPVNDVVIEEAYATHHFDWDSDHDNVANDDDNCPHVSNPQQNDTDMDSIGDVCDDDIDGDGVDNDNDAFPNDSNETADYDGDGTGDNADADDDNDGMNDTSDAYPYDQNETTDTDGDGIGDNSDADDDGDGVADTTDNCPYTANANQADADNDGIGTACDGSEEEEETPSVPALGLIGSLLAVCFAVAFRKND